MTSVLLAVNRCPALVAPPNGSLSTNVAVFGTVVNVACDVGFRYEDGTKSKVLTCLENKVWNASVRPCQGTAVI